MRGADEPKTASYSIQAKLLKLFVQRPYPVWALDHMAWVGRINKDQGDPECECNRRLYSGIPEPMRGPAGYLAIIRMMRGAFPDIRWTWRRWLPKATRWPQGLLCGRVSEHRRRSDSGAAFGAQSRRTDLRDQRDRSGPCLFLRVTRILQLCYSGGLECPWAADATLFTTWAC
jgi:hypothetical protein